MFSLDSDPTVPTKTSVPSSITYKRHLRSDGLSSHNSSIPRPRFNRDIPLTIFQKLFRIDFHILTARDSA